MKTERTPQEKGITEILGVFLGRTKEDPSTIGDIFRVQRTLDVLDKKRDFNLDPIVEEFRAIRSEYGDESAILFMLDFCEALRRYRFLKSLKRILDIDLEKFRTMANDSKRNRALKLIEEMDILPTLKHLNRLGLPLALREMLHSDRVKLGFELGLLRHCGRGISFTSKNINEEIVRTLTPFYRSIMTIDAEVLRINEIVHAVSGDYYSDENLRTLICNITQ